MTFNRFTAILLLFFASIGAFASEAPSPARGDTGLAARQYYEQCKEETR